jgi:hypothetical protein
MNDTSFMGPLKRSAQRLSGLSRVRVMEKRKTMGLFPAFPQPLLLGISSF